MTTQKPDQQEAGSEPVTLTPLLASSKCTQSCWNALQATCQCACGGQNHGVFRSGVQSPAPNPTANDRAHYQLTVLFTEQFQGTKGTRKATKHRTPSVKRGLRPIALPRRNTKTPPYWTHTMPLHRVTVTQEHIANGRPRIINNCPIALAINTYLTDIGEPPDTVHVTQNQIRLDNRIRLAVLPTLATWIDHYDNKVAMSGEEFTLLLDFHKSTVEIQK